MAGRRMLQSVNLSAPGFRGLTNRNHIEEPGWATEVDNCVIDGKGRLAARKGWEKVNSTPISATPSVEQLHEYINGSGTSTIISAAASKLYSGTSTLTEITGSLTITDDNWKFANIGGNMVGFQAGHAPIWWDGTGNGETLQSQISDWAATTDYSLGDIVKATGGASATLYFECTADSGSSGGSEPTWDTTEGNTTADSGITWTTRTFPVGDTVLSAFGRIWTTDSTKTVLQYSDLLIPQNFHGGSAGSIDMTSVWVYGMDQIVAIEEFNGFLLIFGKKNIVVYTGPSDPSTMSIQDTVDGTGCVARDSVRNIGTDILFLSDNGVRSFRKTIQEKSMPLNDISKHVRSDLVSYLDAETVSLIRSVYHEREGFYLLSFPTSGIEYCFDVRHMMEDGSYRCTTWSSIDNKAYLSLTNGKLYLGQAGHIGEYKTYLDNASTYILNFASTWMTLGNHNLKFPKSIHTKITGGDTYQLSIKLYYDFEETPKTQQVTLSSISSPAEYNIAEYSGDPDHLPPVIAEWSGGSADIEAHVNTKGYGHTIKLGMSTTINANAISFQNVELHATLGRLD